VLLVKRFELQSLCSSLCTTRVKFSFCTTRPEFLLCTTRPEFLHKLRRICLVAAGLGGAGILACSRLQSALRWSTHEQLGRLKTAAGRNACPTKAGCKQIDSTQLVNKLRSTTKAGCNQIDSSQLVNKLRSSSTKANCTQIDSLTCVQKLAFSSQQWRTPLFIS
jgi:hypothetical protein